MNIHIITRIMLLFLVYVAGVRSQDGWKTYYESSGYKRTPRYEETIRYCKRLEKASAWIRVESFGKSPEGRDLSLVIAAKDGTFSPSAAHRSGKAILLIQNGIHAGEIDGKDASLMLLRDMVITKKKASLLDHVIVLVIPVFNVDGHERFGKYNRINQNGPEEMGWRVTSQNLNLNRDYMKADSPEMQAWLAMFNRWNPDFIIDAHVTDGADYQHVVTYGIESHQNIADPIRSWVNEQCVPLLSSLIIGGVPIAPYISLRDSKDPLAGLMGGVAPPRLSTPYVALHNRPALLIETHMMKDYQTRVEGTYQTIEAILTLMNTDFKALRAAIRETDDRTSNGVESPFPLRFTTVDTPNTVFHYRGFTQKNVPSEVSGGTWIQYTKEPFEADIPRFDSIRVSKSVIPPRAYLIPQQWTEVIRRLKLHGLRVERLKSEKDFDVELYRFSDAKWQQSPYEGRHPVSYTVQKLLMNKKYPAGTAIVRLNQPNARVAIHALEPEAPDAFVAWGFFDAIFEQKEYTEDYVMEPLALEMLAADSLLRVRYDEKVQSDSTFTGNPFARLNYFYQHSPYWDNNVNLYPVARVRTDIPASALMFDK